MLSTDRIIYILSLTNTFYRPKKQKPNYFRERENRIVEIHVMTRLASGYDGAEVPMVGEELSEIVPASPHFQPLSSLLSLLSLSPQILDSPIILSHNYNRKDWWFKPGLK